MLQPSQRLSKVHAVRFKEDEFKHVMNYIQLNGIRNIRDLILKSTSYKETK